ncbi:Serine_threonine-protein kinase PknD [Nocardiopsis dassonvillei]
MGLAEGLAAVHGAGPVHRDLEPGNIILAQDGPRIIDLGIARPLDTTNLTATGAVLGTPPYMSPEQTEGQRAGPPSDVFSPGTVPAFAATGVNPFAAESMAATVRRLIGPAPALIGVPEDAAGLIIECWDKDPEARPTPGHILDRSGQGRPRPPRPKATPVRTAPTRRLPAEMPPTRRTRRSCTGSGPGRRRGTGRAR